MKNQQEVLTVSVKLYDNIESDSDLIMTVYNLDNHLLSIRGIVTLKDVQKYQFIYTQTNGIEIWTFDTIDSLDTYNQVETREYGGDYRTTSGGFVTKDEKMCLVRIIDVLTQYDIVEAVPLLINYKNDIVNTTNRKWRIA